jgi:hypothetical protein
MNPKKIGTKHQFLELQKRFAFGNHLREWHSLEELQADRYRGLVTVRYKAPGGFAVYGISARYAHRVIQVRRGIRGFDPSLIWFNEGAPDHLLTFQGEVMRNHQGLVVFGSDKPGLKMREALKVAVTYTGLTASMKLKRYFNPSSLSDLEAIFDRYPDSVVEFSAYSCNLGCIPGRNVVIWEVRDY